MTRRTSGILAPLLVSLAVAGLPPTVLASADTDSEAPPAPPGSSTDTADTPVGSTPLPGGFVVAAPIGRFSFTETFDGGSNTGGWRFGSFDVIETDGGHPGAFLHDPVLDTFAPQPRTTLGVSSIFTGDYRARAVVSLGADFRIFDVDITAMGRPLTLILRSDNGTPDDPSDDCSAYFIGGRPIPQTTNAWLPYSFMIPTESTVLPHGWAIRDPCSSLGDDHDWNVIITDVDQVAFLFADPTLFYFFQVWDVGMDNPTIRYQVQTP